MIRQTKMYPLRWWMCVNKESKTVEALRRAYWAFIILAYIVVCFLGLIAIIMLFVPLAWLELRRNRDTKDASLL